MSVSIKEVTVLLAFREPLDRNEELKTLRSSGWQVVLINPQGRNEKEQLVCNIQLILMN